MSTEALASAAVTTAIGVVRQPEMFTRVDAMLADEALLNAHIASGDMDAESIARAERTIAQIRAGKREY